MGMMGPLALDEAAREPGFTMDPATDYTEQVALVRPARFLTQDNASLSERAPYLAQVHTVESASAAVPENAPTNTAPMSWDVTGLDVNSLFTLPFATADANHALPPRPSTDAGTLPVNHQNGVDGGGTTAPQSSPIIPGTPVVAAPVTNTALPLAMSIPGLGSAPASADGGAVPSGVSAGQSGVAEPVVAQLTPTPDLPVLTPEQQVQLATGQANSMMPTPALQPGPDGTLGNTPPTVPDMGSRAPSDFVFYRRAVDTPAGAGLSATGSPTVGTMGRTAFESGNFYGAVSGDYGASFAYLNPYNLDHSGDYSGGFAGNARVANGTSGSNSMVFWWLEYNKTGSTVNDVGGGRLAVFNSTSQLLDTSFVYYNFTPPNFNLGRGKWLNWTQMQASSNYLYLTANVFLTTNNAYSQSLLYRIPLSQLYGEGNINFTFWNVTNGASLPLAANSTSTMWSGALINSTAFRLFRQPESETNLYWYDRTGLNTTYGSGFGTHHSITVGNVNWAARSDERVTTGVVLQSTVTFMWNSAEGSGRPQPFIRAITYNTTNETAIAQPDLWSPSVAWQWAALTGSDHAGLAGPVFVGGPGVAPQVNILIVDWVDTAVPPPWANYFAVGGNAASAGWGDYMGASMDQRFGTTYVAGAYIMNGSSVVPYFLWFGRDASNPHKLPASAKADVGNTLGTAIGTTLPPTGGVYTHTSYLWDPTYGRRNVEIYRFQANAGTVLYAATLPAAGGDAVDSTLRLFDASGAQLAIDDDISQNNENSFIQYRFNTGGTYYVGVSGDPNSTYNPNAGGSGVLGAIGDYELLLYLAPASTVAFRVTTNASNPDVAGTPFSVTVTALDSSGGVNTGYTGTVHFASLDPLATLPSDYTFTAADHGVHTFTNGVTFKKEGAQVVGVTDTLFSWIVGVSPSVSVVPARTTTLTVTGFPSPIQAGTLSYFLVTTRDAYGNLTPLYSGTVHFTTSDPQGLVPLNFTFTPLLDPGYHVFLADLRTAGSQELTVTDTADGSITGTQSGIVVTPAPATHFQVDAPSDAQSGNPFDVTVTALDRFGNIDTNYMGTVDWMTSDMDSGVVLPDLYSFTADDNGVHLFAGGVTLITPGDQTITPFDVDSGIQGTATVTVS
jgi:hypothetical protein